MSILVDPDIMQFIYGSSHNEELTKLMRERQIKIKWTPGYNFAELENEGQTNPSLQTESVEALLSFINKFNKCDVQVKKEIWKDVQKQLPNIRANLGDSLVKSFEPQLTFKIVSLCSDIGSCRNRLEAQLSKIYKKVTFQRQTISNFSKQHIILLKVIEIRVMLHRANCEEVEVELDQGKQEVRLAGPSDQLKIATQVFQNLVRRTTEKPLKLDSDVLEVLATELGQKAVKKTLQEQNIEAIMLLFASGQQTAKVLASSDEHAKNAVSLISGLVAKDKLFVTQKHSSLITTKTWFDYCQKTEKKTGVFVRKNSSGETWIVGLRDNVQTAVRMLQYFLDHNAEREEEIICPSADSREYLLRRIKPKIENCGVKVREGEDSLSFFISGQKEPLKKVEDFLNELRKDIRTSDVVFQEPGVIKFYECGQLDERVKEVEEREQCFIRLEKYLTATSSASRSGISSGLANAKLRLRSACSSSSTLIDTTIYATPQGHKISWKPGDITKEKVSYSWLKTIKRRSIN